MVTGLGVELRFNLFNQALQVKLALFVGQVLLLLHLTTEVVNPIDPLLLLSFASELGGCTEFCVNGLMAGNRRTSKSGYDRKYVAADRKLTHLRGMC